MSNDLNCIPPGDASENDEKRKLLENLHQELNYDEDSFEKEAAEGLQQIPSGDISIMIKKLNTSLLQQIAKKKKKKRGISEQPMIYVTIIILLLLIVTAYIILKKLI